LIDEFAGGTGAIVPFADGLVVEVGVIAGVGT
jgi:hypothetical protein